MEMFRRARGCSSKMRRERGGHRCFSSPLRKQPRFTRWKSLFFRILDDPGAREIRQGTPRQLLVHLISLRASLIGLPRDDFGEAKKLR
jgi:hypothetical protein